MPRGKQVGVEGGFNERTLADRLLGDLLPEEIHNARDIKLNCDHSRGTVLFSEGQPARGLYVLRAGRAKVSTSSSKGKVVILRIAQAGDMLGLNSVLKGSTYDATVELLERGQTDYIARTDLMDLLDRSERARTGLAEALSKELTEVVAHARSLLLPQSTSERLAAFLLKWSDERDEQPEGIKVNHGLTQEEIGQMICTSRETVTRLLADLKRQRVLSFARNAIFVNDVRALEVLACS